jgi:hypothetical protein
MARKPSLQIDATDDPQRQKEKLRARRKRFLGVVRSSKQGGRTKRRQRLVFDLWHQREMRLRQLDPLGAEMLAARKR